MRILSFLLPLVIAPALALARQPPLLVTEGRSVLGIGLGISFAAAQARLGRPLEQDAALGQLLARWKIPDQKDPNSYITIYFTRTVKGDHSAEQLLIVGGGAITARGIGVGHTEKRIRTVYRQWRPHLADWNSESHVLDYTAQGVSFRISSAGKCDAILIHRRGERVLVIDFRSD